MGKYAKINTAGAGGLSLWSTTDRSTRKRLITVAKGEIIEILYRTIIVGGFGRNITVSRDMLTNNTLQKFHLSFHLLNLHCLLPGVDAYAVELAHIAQKVECHITSACGVDTMKLVCLVPVPDPCFSDFARKRRSFGMSLITNYCLTFKTIRKH